ncbi:hypothetical protein N7495_001435 [Penicillium taxi]|uniref:uncharacterized protein n=1 Tax=Penicillium taxi TaxID=168475 RepID=UPI002545391A|nr:uncharacterized protein N7495_001435 [Penicillium taxi]KAJ5908753.1 hypothetical protein N7495_001435 [Penicillium taxi]
MILKTLAILATLGLATAQTSVVSLFIYDIDPQPLVASIIAEGSGTTTFSINCPPGTDGSDCGMGPGLYYTLGPSTIEMSMSEPQEGFWDHIGCTSSGTTAICTEIASGTGANFPGTSTTAIPKGEATLFPVTVTAGPSAGASLSTTADRTTQTPSSTDSSERTTSQTSDKSSTQTSGKSSASATSGTSTGGLPQITGNPGLALGSAAIALMAAAL